MKKKRDKVDRWRWWSVEEVKRGGNPRGDRNRKSDSHLVNSKLKRMVTLLSARYLVIRSRDGGLMVQMELELPTIFT